MNVGTCIFVQHGACCNIYDMAAYFGICCIDLFVRAWSRPESAICKYGGGSSEKMKLLSCTKDRDPSIILLVHKIASPIPGFSPATIDDDISYCSGFHWDIFSFLSFQCLSNNVEERNEGGICHCIVVGTFYWFTGVRSHVALHDVGDFQLLNCFQVWEMSVMLVVCYSFQDGDIGWRILDIQNECIKDVNVVALTSTGI